MRNIYFLIFNLITVFLFSSCVTKSKVNYFNVDSQMADSTFVNRYYNGPIFEIGDIIDISIQSNSKDVIDQYPYLTNQGIRTNQTYLSGSPIQKGFTIDTTGFIFVPNLGKIKAVGKSKYELQEEICSLLSGNIKYPIVEVKLLNFKITILGDVKLPGIYQIPNDRATLFEGLALAGDLNYTGNRKEIKLIRTTNGIQKVFKIDLTKSHHFNTDYYFLKQNDLIFVSTTSTRLNQINFSQFYLPAISSLSLIVTFLNLIK